VIFSIITPSFNQASFLRKTMDSVLDQHVKLEYIIIDGGSTDGSSEIIQSRKDRLKFWISEKDSGQAQAINKGFLRAEGDIIGWLNSDDIYLQGALLKIMKEFENPKVMWVTGDCEVINENDLVTGYYKTELPLNYFHWLNLFVRGYSCSMIQPSTFFRINLLKEVGYLDESLHYSFDHEFFLRILRKYGMPKIIPEPLSRFRIHSSSKTSLNKKYFLKENRIIGLRYAKEEPLKRRLYLYAVNFRQKFIND
jgi:glycosyltransferase involved in cell wall biosynthesis